MSSNEMYPLECIKSELDNNTIAYIMAEPNAVSSYDNGIKTETDLKYLKEDEDLSVKYEEILIKEEIELNVDRDVNDSYNTFFVETTTKHTSEVHVIKTVNNRRRRKIVHQCNVCQFESSYKRVLKKHMRIHIGNKPFVCQVCDYKSSEKCNLVKHMRIHAGEKPFVCHICDYKSSEKCNLTRHMRIHTGKKPFVCYVCEYKCSVRSSLARHIKIHSV